VLAEYQGTILLVSHDRYLIDALATQIWEIDEVHNLLHVFKGSYSEYRLFRDIEREKEKILVTEARMRAGEVKQRSQESRRNTNEERRRQSKILEVENEISNLEEQLRGLEEHLANPPADPGKVQKLGNDYMYVKHQIDALMLEWEQLHNNIT
jgi:ATP-binding cassette subfamily F protein 3